MYQRLPILLSAHLYNYKIDNLLETNIVNKDMRKIGGLYVKQWIYALLAFLGGVSFGIPSTFVKIAYENGFTTAEVVGIQYFIGALLLWIAMFWGKKEKVTFPTIIKLLLSGAPMALTGVFYYQSLIYLDASIAIIILFQFTWMGVIAEWIIDKKQPTKEKLLSVSLLFIGSLLAVNVTGASLTALPIQGILWGLLGAMSFTAFIFVSGKVGVHIHPVRKSMLMSTGALMIIIVIYPPTFLWNGSIGEGLWIWGLILGIFAVVLPPFLFSISMPKIGSGLGTILSASELPTAICMSMIVLQEKVVFMQWIGVLLVLLGIVWPVLLQLYQKRRQMNR